MAKHPKTIALRGLAVVSYLIAAIVMFVSCQKFELNSIEFIVRYNDWSSFVFFVVVVCIACGYNIVVFLIPSGSPLWKTIIVLDVCVNIIVAASLGAGWQTFWLLNNGNINTGWLQICKTVPLFCSKTGGALSTGSLGFFSSFSLLMYTLHISVDPFLVGGQ